MSVQFIQQVQCVVGLLQVYVSHQVQTIKSRHELGGTPGPCLHILIATMFCREQYIISLFIRNLDAPLSIHRLRLVYFSSEQVVLGILDVEARRSISSIVVEVSMRSSPEVTGRLGISGG